VVEPVPDGGAGLVDEPIHQVGLDLGDIAAAGANGMVVWPVGQAVPRRAVLAEHVYKVLCGEGEQHPVHGGPVDLREPGRDRFVDLLSGQVALVDEQGLDDRPFGDSPPSALSAHSISDRIQPSPELGLYHRNPPFARYTTSASAWWLTSSICTVFPLRPDTRAADRRCACEGR
jgi:hypothetical protein